MTSASDVWTSALCCRRLDPRLVEWMQRQRWRDLRPLQLRAAQHLLTSDRHLLITAGVASGKTEAALLPILTRVAARASAGFSVLYVSPLVALINDQAERLQAMADAVGLQATPWHGEVAESVKRAARRDPYGVLLITPESLDSLVTRRPREVERVLGELQYVVIDELHAFLGAERGQQLRSALARIEQLTARKPIRVGLSATLGDLDSGRRWLAGLGAQSVHHIPDSTPPAAPRVEFLAVPLPTLSSPTQGSRRDVARLLVTMRAFEAGLRTGKHLVFANSRGEVEAASLALAELWRPVDAVSRVYVHHSSIARDGRNDAEEALRTQPHAIAVCTSTLELGLDVPHVASVTQIGAPFSAAALKQRAGRTGRRGQPGLLRVVVPQDPTAPAHGLVSRLRPDLVQAVAMVELVLAGWFEAPRTDQLHLSVLVHQILSLLRQTGGARPTPLWTTLCRDGAFENVDWSQFVALLTSLKNEELIVQDADSPVIRLAVEGDRTVNHYTFPVLFEVPTEWNLVHGERTLGALPCSTPIVIGDRLVFAGKRWEVVQVDGMARRLQVKPSRSGAVPGFEGGSAGFLDGRVRQQMRDVYSDEREPDFLDAAAKVLLREARSEFRNAGLGQGCLVPAADDTLIFHWDGDRAATTLRLLLVRAGIRVGFDGVAFRGFGVSAQQVRNCLEGLVNSPAPDPLELAMGVPNKRAYKYDRYLSEGLLAADYARRVIDVAGAVAVAHRVLAHS